MSLSSTDAMSCSPFSGFDRAGGQACDDVLLREEEDDHGWHDRQRYEGENQLPLCPELPAINHDTERPRVLRLGVQHDQRQNVAVPAVDEGNDADRCDDWPDRGSDMYQKKRM